MPRLEIDDSALRRQLMVVPGGGDMEGLPSEVDNIARGQSSPPNDLEALTLPDEAASHQRRPQLVEIQPTPGVCYKARDTDGGKVFVNLCSSDSIPMPEKLTEDQLQLLMKDGGVDQLRIPLSMAEGHRELDKSGVSCFAYDVVVHPRFLSQVQKSSVFQTFIALVLIDAIKSKFGVQLVGESWLALRNKRYMGRMPRHTIRGRDMPLVQEFSGLGEVPVEDAPPAAPIREISSRRHRQPSAELADGPAGTQLVRITLPLVAAAAADLRVEALKDRLLVYSDSQQVLCDVPLPRAVDPDLTRAACSSSSGRMVIVLFPPKAYQKSVAQQ